MIPAWYGDKGERERGQEEADAKEVLEDLWDVFLKAIFNGRSAHKVEVPLNELGGLLDLAAAVDHGGLGLVEDLEPLVEGSLGERGLGKAERAKTWAEDERPPKCRCSMEERDRKKKRGRTDSSVSIDVATSGLEDGVIEVLCHAIEDHVVGTLAKELDSP